jgi:hypothetical protein
MKDGIGGLPLAPQGAAYVGISISCFVQLTRIGTRPSEADLRTFYDISDVWVTGRRANECAFLEPVQWPLVKIVTQAKSALGRRSDRHD